MLLCFVFVFLRYCLWVIFARQNEIGCRCRTDIRVCVVIQLRILRFRKVISITRHSTLLIRAGYPFAVELLFSDLKMLFMNELFAPERPVLLDCECLMTFKRWVWFDCIPFRCVAIFGIIRCGSCVVTTVDSFRIAASDELRQILGESEQAAVCYVSAFQQRWWADEWFREFNWVDVVVGGSWWLLVVSQVKRSTWRTISDL